MRGSGYVEIIEEARLVANGCIKNVKEFAKVLFNLKAVNEMKRLSTCCWRCFAEKKTLEYILHVCLLSLVHIMEVILIPL